MAGKNLSLLKGVFTVSILALLIFVVFFFFFPDVSLKYYGAAFDMNKAMSNTVAAIVSRTDYMSEEEKAELTERLSSPEGKEVISSLLEAAEAGHDAVDSVVKSEEFQSLASSVKSSLSQESFERFLSDVGDAASSLFSRFSNED